MKQRCSDCAQVSDYAACMHAPPFFPFCCVVFQHTTAANGGHAKGSGGHFVSMVAAGDDTFMLLDDLPGRSGYGRRVVLTADVVNSSNQLMQTVTEFLGGAARGNFALYRRNDLPPPPKIRATGRPKTVKTTAS